MRKCMEIALIEVFFLKIYKFLISIKLIFEYIVFNFDGLIILV